MQQLSLLLFDEGERGEAWRLFEDCVREVIQKEGKERERQRQGEERKGIRKERERRRRRLMKGTREDKRLS